jgi:hypothetical protein
MEKLIVEALNFAFEELQKQIPETRTETRYTYIGDVGPLMLLEFIKFNDIPNDCFFSIVKGYISLEWEVNIPLTTTEKVRYRIDRYYKLASAEVYAILTTNGFKKVEPNSYSLRKFDDDNIYDMYINNDYSRVIEYFSLFYRQIENTTAIKLPLSPN